MGFYNVEKQEMEQYNPRLAADSGQQHNEEENVPVLAQQESGGSVNSTTFVEQEQQNPEDLGWGYQYVEEFSTTGRGENDEGDENQNIVDISVNGAVVVGNEGDAIVRHDTGDD